MLTMRRTVITGIGAVTPLGNTFVESWTAAKEGRSGIAPITKFDASRLRWKAAGEIKDFDPDSCLGSREVKRLDNFIHYAAAAAAEALKDSGLTNEEGKSPDPGYLGSGGVIIGSSRGGISAIEKALLKLPEPSGSRLSRLSAFLMPSTTISMASSYIAQKFFIKGYCLGISNACASGSNAIGEAYRMIKAGFKGPVVAGGAEAPICRLCVAGYGATGALSKTRDFTASRPFSRSRDGFVLAEGACVLVLENLDAALKRGAAIYGEIAGYSNTADAVHQVKPSAEGEAEAMSSAIAEAGLGPKDIDYVSAHGTSTVMGDRAEAEALGKVLGDRASLVPVTAVKSLTGHMLAGSGALEAGFTLMTLRDKVIPPTINLEEGDNCCGLDVITEKKEAEVSTAISNSFGFGGVNAVLVLRSLRL